MTTNRGESNSHAFAYLHELAHALAALASSPLWLLRWPGERASEQASETQPASQPTDTTQRNATQHTQHTQHNTTQAKLKRAELPFKLCVCLCVRLGAVTFTQFPLARSLGCDLCERALRIAHNKLRDSDRATESERASERWRDGETHTNSELGFARSPTGLPAAGARSVRRRAFAWAKLDTLTRHSRHSRHSRRLREPLQVAARRLS